MANTYTAKEKSEQKMKFTVTIQPQNMSWQYGLTLPRISWCNTKWIAF